ncbi:MAG: Maf family protein [Corallococcus sp.]|nr:Maf family protein [Bacillota bacterium]MCM1533321.1 Maf family protein [Corallococcus sp.]
MELILASNSPRRKELLSKLDYPFKVIPSNCEERTNAALPVDMVKELALRKSLNVYRDNKDAVVIGCDTVVDLNGEVLGKPATRNAAVEMLRKLSGRSHKVHSGVCVMSGVAVYLFVETTEVTFYDLTEERINDYVKGGSCMDKAGAYGIQDSGFVCKIIGDYDNVVGFPTAKIDGILKRIYKR